MDEELSPNGVVVCPEATAADIVAAMAQDTAEISARERLVMLFPVQNRPPPTSAGKDTQITGKMRWIFPKLSNLTAFSGFSDRQ